MEEQKDKLPIDRGWAWVIVAANFCLFAVISGAFKSQGILLVEVEEKFDDVSPTAVLWIFSLCNFFSKILGPVNSFLIHITSNRTVSFVGVIFCSLSLCCMGYLPSVTYMYIVYGILYGWGVGLINISCFTATVPFFDKKKALAVGLITSGSGIGTICTPNILRTAFDKLHFSSAMLVYGGFFLQLLVAASLLRPFSFYDRRKKCDQGKNLSAGSGDVKLEGSEKLGAAEDDDQDHHILSSPDDPSTSNHHEHTRFILASTGNLSGSAYALAQTDVQVADEMPTSPSYNWKLIINPLMLMMGCSVMVYSLGTSVVYQCIPPLGKSRGVSKQFIANIFSVAGGVEIPARISNGLLADKKYISALSQYCICVFLTSLCALTCAIVSNQAGITVMLLGMSTVGTSVYSLSPAVFSELLGKENVTPAMGLFFSYQAIAFPISTPIAGFLYEKFGMWELVYYYVGGCMLLGAFIPTPYIVYSYIKSRRAKELPQEGGSDENPLKSA